MIFDRSAFRLRDCGMQYDVLLSESWYKIGGTLWFTLLVRVTLKCSPRV